MSTSGGGPPPRPTRRALLGAALVAPALAACSSERSPEPAPVADPDEGLRAAAVARERTLLKAYDEALAAHPALQSRLSSVRREHEEHLRALGAAAPSASASASASAGASVSASAPASPSAPPSRAASTSPAAPASRAASASPSAPTATQKQALAKLVGIEATAARGHSRDALVASRRLAPVLASLAASEATHGLVLR